MFDENVPNKKKKTIFNVLSIKLFQYIVINVEFKQNVKISLFSKTFKYSLFKMASAWLQSHSANDQKKGDKTANHNKFFLLFVHEYVWPICFSAQLFERGIYKPRPTTLNSITIFIHGNLSDSINQLQQWQF